MESNKFQTKKMGFLIVFTLLIACEQNSIAPPGNEELISEISYIDSRPIIELRDRGTLDSELFEEIKNNLIKSYGSDLVSEVKAKLSEKKSFDGLVLIKDIPLKKKTQSSTSTHFKVIEDEELIDEFVLAVRPYKNNDNMAAKMANSSDDVWIALDPDKFYLEDDEYGNEIWPITIEGNHITDPDRVIELTFDESGLIYSVEKSMLKSKAITDPSIILVETIPVEPCEIQLKSTSSTEDGCHPSGGGGGSNPPSSGRVNDWTRGESTGTYGTNQTYVVLKGVQLAVTGDGGSASELQFFSKKNDNMMHNMPVSYKYRFDAVFRSHPYANMASVNTYIEGADKGGPFFYFYEVPDINSAGVFYDFEDVYRSYLSVLGYTYFEHAGYFPLFNLTKTGGPWRFTLVDDDKDYADMSTRRKNTRIMDVNTFHMDTGSWEVVETGFTTRNHYWGSSDDPLLDSGVRRIDLNNVLKFTRIGEDFTINYLTENGYFVYKLGLE